MKFLWSRGIFYAKVESPNSQMAKTIGGFLQVDSQSLTISTRDNVSTLKEGEKIVSNGEEWYVISLQRVQVKKQSEFNMEPAVATYIVLRK